MRPDGGAPGEYGPVEIGPDGRPRRRRRRLVRKPGAAGAEPGAPGAEVGIGREPGAEAEPGEEEYYYEDDDEYDYFDEDDLYYEEEEVVEDVDGEVRRRVVVECDG